jgi:hypothetical protein
MVGTSPIMTIDGYSIKHTEREDCIMRRAAILWITVSVVYLLLGSVAYAQEDVTIVIAPKQFVLDYQGTKVTVHTSIVYGDAINGSIDMHNMDGASINPIGFFADDRGFLVVKFAAEDLQLIVSPPSAKLTMTGELTSGGNFIGTDMIRVK